MKKKQLFKQNQFQVNPRHSVGMRIFLTFFLSIVLSVLLLGIISFNTSKNIIKQEVSKASEQTVREANAKLDLIYKQYDNLTIRFATEPELSKRIESYRKANMSAFDLVLLEEELQNSLQTMVYNDTYINGIHLYDYSGNPVVTYSENSGDINKDLWFDEVAAGDGKMVWVPTNVLTTNENTPVFGIGRVLSNLTTMEKDLVVLIELNYAAIADQMANFKLGDESEAYIVADDGNIIYAADPALIGQKLYIDMDNISNAVSFETKDQQGKDILVISHQAEQTSGWFAVGTVLVSELVKEAGSIQSITLTIAFIAAILAVVLGYFISSNIAKPLQHLSELMSQGAQGDLSVRFTVKSKDEIGKLGESFNGMIEQLNHLAGQSNQMSQEVFDMSSKLSDVAKKTAMSVKEVSVATEQIASGASTLAVEAEKGNELSINIREQMQNVVNANVEMGQSAGEVRHRSNQGTSYMDVVTAKTKQTEEMTRSMVEKVTELKESTNSIHKILEVLSNISKQTNILSLNATIEAARAGESGKGFMVVADEIRKLADQSKQSIQVVGEITDQIQTEIDSTVTVLSDAYPVFQEQSDSVRQADEIFADVGKRMDDFIEKLDQVTASIQQLDESQHVLSEAMSNVSAVSEESSATSEEVASLCNEQLTASEELVQLSNNLEGLSKSLMQTMEKFKTE